MADTDPKMAKQTANAAGRQQRVAGPGRPAGPAAGRGRGRVQRVWGESCAAPWRYTSRRSSHRLTARHPRLATAAGQTTESSPPSRRSWSPSAATAGAPPAGPRRRRCRRRSCPSGGGSGSVAWAPRFHTVRSSNPVAYTDPVPHFQRDQRQRPARRAGDRPALVDLEVPVVARAVQLAPLQVRDHGAGQVASTSGRRRRPARRRGTGQARLVLVRVAELDHAARPARRPPWRSACSGNGPLVAQQARQPRSSTGRRRTPRSSAPGTW